MNGGILKSKKRFAELKSAIKYEMSCLMNVVSYAQIAFKKLIFQARPASAHAELQRAYALMTHDSRFVFVTYTIIQRM